MIEERQRKTAVNNSHTRGDKVRSKEIHAEANKEVQRSVRNYIEDLAMQAEEAATSKN